MAITRLEGDHVHLTCDYEGCTLDLIRHGMTEDELLAVAAERGWQIGFGLHYCPLQAMHECSVCGAGTRDSVLHAGDSERVYFCQEHWPL